MPRTGSIRASHRSDRHDGSAAWYYEKKNLSHQFRLSLWDLPGLGLSSQPPDRQYSLERFAQDLKAVLDASSVDVILASHSIGGMTLLTFCRLFPELLGTKVIGLVVAKVQNQLHELTGPYRLWQLRRNCS